MTKVIDLIVNVARCVGLDMLAECLELGATPSDPDLVHKENILIALNRTLESLAVTHFPFVATRTITVAGGEYNLTRLPQKFFRAIALKVNGVSVDFEVYGVVLRAANGTYELEYRFIPDKLTEDGELPDLNFPIDRLLAYGAATEFCLTNGRYNDAWNWQRAFALEVAAAERACPPRSATVRARAWA